MVLLVTCKLLYIHRILKSSHIFRVEVSPELMLVINALGKPLLGCLDKLLDENLQFGFVWQEHLFVLLVLEEVGYLGDYPK